MGRVSHSPGTYVVLCCVCAINLILNNSTTAINSVNGLRNIIMEGQNVELED